MAQLFGVGFEIKDFTHVPIEDCIKNDLNRLRSVGEKVIRSMHREFLTPVKRFTYEPTKQDETLPHAIICDLDGTLAHMNGRGPFEWLRVGEDIVDEQIMGLLQLCHKYQILIIIMSGRDMVCANQTKEWLFKNNIPHCMLLMRTMNDNRKDAVVKEELFNNYVKDKYFIDFVLDDRDQVVQLWRGLGLKCLQVADGNF
jgi:hypothetical protein